MRSTLKTLAILAIPMALTLHGTVASAKKHKKHKKHDDEVAAAAEPAPAAAASATTSASVDASVAPTAAPAAATASVGISAETSVAPPPVPAVAPVVTAEAAATVGRPRDRVRFRGGISVGGGGEFVSGFGFGMGGIDGRLGVQINNLIGVYVQPHVSAGAGSVNGVSGATATAGATAMIDFTIKDRGFAGIGVGGGILNNPAGAELQIRGGGYPVIKFAADGPRRKALMVGLDLRVFFISVPTVVPVMQVMAGIGYEAF